VGSRRCLSLNGVAPSDVYGRGESSITSMAAFSRRVSAFIAASLRLRVVAAFRPAALRFRVAAALRPAALRLRVNAAFLPAARRLRVRAAFCAAAFLFFELVIVMKRRLAAAVRLSLELFQMAGKNSTIFASGCFKRHTTVVSVSAGSGVGSPYISHECPADSLRFAAIHFLIASCVSFMRLDDRTH